MFRVNLRSIPGCYSQRRENRLKPVGDTSKVFCIGEVKMNELTLNHEQKMSSREIAELTEIRHDSVKRTIETLADKGIIESPQIVNFKNINNVEGQEYLICKRDSYIVVAQLSPAMTARLVDRWQELEAKQVLSLPDFNNPVIAARAWADAKESEQAALVQLEAARPAVEFVERYVEAKSSKCLSDVAKLLKHKPQAFFKLLSDNEVIFKRSGSWIPYQKHIDKGRFTVTTGEGNGHTYQQTRVEPDGIVWLAKMFPA
jgi:phage antirepressor YoqD-like protein